MSIRLLVPALLILAALPIVPLASACINNCQPVVYVCSDVADPSCGHTVCVASGETVPFCKDAPPTIISCGYESENTALVGVTYHGCTQVDGYVCTEPRYMGGQGIKGGFVCFGYATVALP